jgi:hypothetical protein
MTSNQSDSNFGMQFRARRLVVSNQDVQDCIDCTIASIPVRFANALESVEKMEARGCFRGLSKSFNYRLASASFYFSSLAPE